MLRMGVEYGRKKKNAWKREKRKRKEKSGVCDAVHIGTRYEGGYPEIYCSSVGSGWMDG